MGFIETSYGNSPNLSDVHIDSILNMGNYGITASGNLNILNTMDLNNNDLIGVKRFICADFLGALKLVGSDVQQWVLTLNDPAYDTYSDKFRVPSNVVDSTIYLKIYAQNTYTSNCNIRLYKYNSDSNTYTNIDTIIIPPNTSTPTEFTSSELTVKAGEIYCMKSTTHTNCKFFGSMGVKVLCDISPVTSAIWEVIS